MTITDLRINFWSLLIMGKLSQMTEDTIFALIFMVMAIPFLFFIVKDSFKGK